MKLENQVVSLELAKKLKELGVEKKSFLYWCKHREVGWSLGYEESPGFYACYSIDGMAEREPFSGYGREHHHDTDGEVYSAFTVAELGEMLPATIDGKYNDKTRWYNSRITSVAGVWYDNDREDELISIEAETEADARAKMLIYLLENNLLNI